MILTVTQILRNPKFEIRIILNEPFQDCVIVIFGTCVVEAIKSDSPGEGTRSVIGTSKIDRVKIKDFV